MSQWAGFTSQWYAGEKKEPKRSKMGNIPTRREGIRFDSKLEARYYDFLQFLVATGEVLYFLRQVPFHLPANVTYRADFMVFYKDGSHEVIDVKARLTPIFRLKQKQVELLYPVKIKIVKKGDFPEL